MGVFGQVISTLCCLWIGTENVLSLHFPHDLPSVQCDTNKSFAFCIYFGYSLAEERKFMNHQDS